MTERSESAETLTDCRRRRCCSFSHESSASRLMPIMAFIDVLISCDMLARKALFDRSEPSARSRASRISCIPVSIVSAISFKAQVSSPISSRLPTASLVCRYPSWNRRIPRIMSLILPVRVDAIHTAMHSTTRIITKVERVRFRVVAVTSRPIWAWVSSWSRSSRSTYSSASASICFAVAVAEPWNSSTLAPIVT